jgi:hypothetical protein
LYRQLVSPEETRDSDDKSNTAHTHTNVEVEGDDTQTFDDEIQITEVVDEEGSGCRNVDECEGNESDDRRGDVPTGELTAAQMLEQAARKGVQRVPQVSMSLLHMYGVSYSVYHRLDFQVLHAPT